MITLTALSFNCQALAGLSARFDELGGNIGRADTNQLVLADPERSVSRVHAQVVFRNDGYALLDRGSNAVLLNDQPVGNGREVPLRDGDLLTVGAYLVRVSQGAVAPVPAPTAPPSPRFAAPAGSPVPASFNDPFGDPFAGPFRSATPTAAPRPPFQLAVETRRVCCSGTHWPYQQCRCGPPGQGSIAGTCNWPGTQQCAGPYAVQ